MARARGWLGARASVVIALAVAALSIATGVASIVAPTGAATTPLAAILPELVTLTAGFSGTLTGFLMLASAFGLRRGFRSAWYATVVLLPVMAVQGLLQASDFAFPLVVLSLLALPVLLVNRRRFDRALDVTTTQLAAATALVGSQVYGTAGAYALRGQFSGIRSVTDAFYFTIVTGSTVGYGDITPQTEVARLFGVSVLLVSVSSFAVALGVLLAPAIEARLSKVLGQMTQSQLDLLENHVLVLGYGDLTEPILESLDGQVQVLVVTPDAERERLLADRDVDALTADPGDEEPLRRAGIAEARAVVAATDDDAADALAILTARQLNPDLRIVAAANQRENVNKLKLAGADAVISPASIGGRLLAESALDSTEAEVVADRLLDGDLDAG
ncbi:MAG: NAD-binding protein [Salinigranum sp.]